MNDSALDVHGVTWSRSRSSTVSSKHITGMSVSSATGHSHKCPTLCWRFQSSRSARTAAGWPRRARVVLSNRRCYPGAVVVLPVIQPSALPQPSDPGPLCAVSSCTSIIRLLSYVFCCSRVMYKLHCGWRRQGACQWYGGLLPCYVSEAVLHGQKGLCCTCYATVGWHVCCTQGFIRLHN